MKKIFYLSVVFLVSGTLMLGCMKTKKEEDAQDEVELAKDNLKEVRKDSRAEQWNAFKGEIDAKVAANEARIAELKERMNRSGQDIDVLYKKRIDQLEQRNMEIKAKIGTFQEQSESDWESFKREFNHDADELGNAIRDIGVDNKK